MALGSAPRDGHSGRPTTLKAALGLCTPAAADATPAVLDWCLMMLLQLMEVLQLMEAHGNPNWRRGPAAAVLACPRPPTPRLRRRRSQIRSRTLFEYPARWRLQPAVSVPACR